MLAAEARVRPSPKGSTLLMAALESPQGRAQRPVRSAQSSDRLIGIALSGGDFTQVHLQTVTHRRRRGAHGRRGST